MLSRHSIEVMLATYASGESWLSQLLPYLQANHDLLYDFVQSTPGLAMQPLEATYLAWICLLYTSPSPRDGLLSRMPSSA